MDSSCLWHMTGNKKCFSSLTSLSHKEYVNFGGDKKGKVFGTYRYPEDRVPPHKGENDR
jgi:hypothetical protein